ncbi:hypothetical protein M422DRAFT_153650, partial [Sphaerobolus stellatus SS14]
PNGECPSGSLQCCDSLFEIDLNPQFQQILSLFPVTVSPPNALAGMSCTPITSSAQCNTQPVCCQYNNWNGLVRPSNISNI